MVFDVIANGAISGSYMFADFDTAQDFFTRGFLAPGDTITQHIDPTHEPPAPTADPLADVDALAVDHELRLTMLELGLTTNL